MGAGRANVFEAQGHRGARGLLPENTLAGFARALTIGVSTLELDVGLSRDRTVVVTHNPRLEPDTARGPDGHWLQGSGPAVFSLTLAQIKSYDVGRLNPSIDYAERYPHQVPIDGARIPTLGEVMDLVMRSGLEDVGLNIELKLQPGEPELTPSPREFAEAVLTVVRDRGFTRRVTLQSFDWRPLQILQILAPDIPTSYLTIQQDWYDTVRPGTRGISPWLAGFDPRDFGGDIPRLIKSAGGQSWSAHFRDLTPQTLARAHELGLRVVTWTVNDCRAMRELIEMGVDGIISDYPNRLREAMSDCGLSLPPCADAVTFTA